MWPPPPPQPAVRVTVTMERAVSCLLYLFMMGSRVWFGDGMVWRRWSRVAHDDFRVRAWSLVIETTDRVLIWRCAARSRGDARPVHRGPRAPDDGARARPEGKTRSLRLRRDSGGDRRGHADRRVRHRADAWWLARRSVHGQRRERHGRGRVVRRKERGRHHPVVGRLHAAVHRRQPCADWHRRCDSTHRHAI